MTIPSKLRMMNFRPLPEISSPHLQTILAQYGPKMESPPSENILIQLDDGDVLSCHASWPNPYKINDPILVCLHGLGGSHNSAYLRRLSAKMYAEGMPVFRINMRGCGTGKGLAMRPYHGGISYDILLVLKYIRKQYPFNPITVIGFSLGGNIVLKLAGELGKQAANYIDHLIAICPSIDLEYAARCLLKPSSWVYQRYYLQHLMEQSENWLNGQVINSVYEYDDKITSVYWGWKNAHEYYTACSSRYYIENIAIPTDILFAEDDPFIDWQPIKELNLPDCVNVSITQYGGHMGFIGWAGKDHGYYWMDQLLKGWIQKKPVEIS